MKRRDFGKAIATGAAGAALGAPLAATQAKPSRKAAMHVGCQSGGVTTENLEFKARHGVFNIDGDEPKRIEGKGWDLEDSLRKRDACEKYRHQARGLSPVALARDRNHPVPGDHAGAEPAARS